MVNAMPIYHVTVNGENKRIESADPEQPLLYILRNDLSLTGAKYGCGLGQCGTCSILVDNEVMRSCQLTISQANGKKITTIEGLLRDGKLHPVQTAFVEEQAAQCGYCTNGMVMTAVSLLAHQANPKLSDVKEALANNLCRCGTHDRIIRAVMSARGKVMP